LTAATKQTKKVTGAGYETTDAGGEEREETNDAQKTTGSQRKKGNAGVSIPAPTHVNIKPRGPTTA
jgi:hypothetical protein